MVRRMQLLESERRFSVRRVAALGERIRDGLLRDNKVVPPVLAALALLVFAWLTVGVLMGDTGDEKERQASSQASLAQEAPKEDPGQGDSGGTLAPGADNRDTESFAAFKPKDPFRQLTPKAGETTGESTTGRSGTVRESTTGRSGY